MIASPHGPRRVAAEAVEIARHIPLLATKRRLDTALLFAALQVMPIEWKPATTTTTAAKTPRSASPHARMGSTP